MTVTPPCSVNFIAFEIRLLITYDSRTESHVSSFELCSSPSLGSRRRPTLKAMPLVCATGRKILLALRSNCLRSRSLSTRASRPS